MDTTFNGFHNNGLDRNSSQICSLKTIPMSKITAFGEETVLHMFFEEPYTEFNYNQTSVKQATDGYCIKDYTFQY